MAFGQGERKSGKETCWSEGTQSPTNSTFQHRPAWPVQVQKQELELEAKHLQELLEACAGNSVGSCQFFCIRQVLSPPTSQDVSEEIKKLHTVQPGAWLLHKAAQALTPHSLWQKYVWQSSLVCLAVKISLDLTCGIVT